MKHIRGYTALITGGASGIGKLMALDLARRGARVMVWDLRQDALEACIAEAQAQGLELRGATCNVADRDMVYQRARELEQELGGLDILINNAGVVSGSTFLETPDEKIELTMAVNTMALFWTTKAFLPGMIERRRGHVVTIASAAGLIGVRGLADYSASKFAAVGFNEAIRTELARLRSPVRTTVVCPFFINTGMFDGVHTRFPFLLPILKAPKVADRIVKATLRGRRRLIMPRMVYSVFLLRLFPVAFMDAVAGFFGINRSMDNFRGRQS